MALDRSLDVFVALVGVLKAGAAFVVLDPGHPPKRLAHILRDTAAPVVLTRSDLLPSLPEPDGWTAVCLDTDWARIEASAALADDAAWEEVGGDSLAYVLYTSGSTGEPKGVLIEHRALMLFVTSFIDLYGLGPGDRVLQYASLIFDLSEGEIFAAPHPRGDAGHRRTPTRSCRPRARRADPRPGRHLRRGAPPGDAGGARTRAVPIGPGGLRRRRGAVGRAGQPVEPSRADLRPRLRPDRRRSAAPPSCASTANGARRRPSAGRSLTAASTSSTRRATWRRSACRASFSSRATRDWAAGTSTSPS